MFVGHFSAAFAAKALEPRAPLWALIGGAQLLDIGWGSLILAGGENARIDEKLPGSFLDLYHMPWTHSLPSALLWSAGAALLAVLVLKLPRGAAIAIGLVVFSHWFLDLLVHRPDLGLWFDGPKVGFALWDSPVLEATIEIGLLGLAVAAWMAQRVRSGGSATPVILFFALLIALQIAPQLMPVPADIKGLAVNMLTIFLVLIGIAAFIDRTPKRQSANFH